VECYSKTNIVTAVILAENGNKEEREEENKALTTILKSST